MMNDRVDGRGVMIMIVSVVFDQGHWGFIVLGLLYCHCYWEYLCAGVLVGNWNATLWDVCAG